MTSNHRFAMADFRSLNCSIPGLPRATLMFHFRFRFRFQNRKERKKELTMPKERL
jgi:hypothetical protein